MQKKVETTSSDRVNWRKELTWVYLNLNNDGERDRYTERPPSSGSRSFLTWARENLSDFMAMVRPVIAKANSAERVQGFEDDDEPVLEMIEEARAIRNRELREEVQQSDGRQESDNPRQEETITDSREPAADEGGGP